MTERPNPDLPPVVKYAASPASEKYPKHLILRAGTSRERSFTFFDRVEIGRLDVGRESQQGQLLVEDPTVSSRHCIITQNAEGRCFIRDVSRNGTRLCGRRLIPNQEVEVHVGDTIRVGQDCEFLLAGKPAPQHAGPRRGASSTLAVPARSEVTILVGDIRNYTSLVRRAPSMAVQQSVDRLFQRLESEIVALGGTIKEHQGDAIFAFWEESASKDQAVRACAAALALDKLVREIASDTELWDVPGFSLEMDWALTTGNVAIDTYGGESPTGLSMIGAPVILAFRLEKLASDETGSVLACPATREAAAHEFEFADLGKIHAKGFDHPDRVYALIGKLA